MVIDPIGRPVADPASERSHPMRVLVTMKSNHESEAGHLPSPALMAKLGVYNEELERAGILLGGEGIRPS